MRRSELYERLIEIARQIYDRVEVSPGDFRGGTCRVRGEHFLVLNKNATLDQNLKVLADALASRDLEGRYLLPALREAIEKYTDLDTASAAASGGGAEQGRG